MGQSVVPRNLADRVKATSSPVFLKLPPNISKGWSQLPYGFLASMIRPQEQHHRKPPNHSLKCLGLDKSLLKSRYASQSTRLCMWLCFLFFRPYRQSLEGVSCFPDLAHIFVFILVLFLLEVAIGIPTSTAVTEEEKGLSDCAVSDTRNSP